MKNTKIAAFGAAMILAGWAGGALAAPYDLVCSGTMVRLHRYERPNGPPKPFTTTLRIDPDKGVFCQDKCRKTEKIASVAGQTLKLRSNLLSQEMEGLGDSFSVDQGRGAMLRFTFYPTKPHGMDHEYNLDRYDASCRRAPFTGLHG